MRSSLLCACLFALVGAGPVAASPASKATKPVAAVPAATPASAPLLVDINRADRDTLKSLPGVGDAEADQIVAARPYQSKAELVTKKALPMGVFLNLKRNVTVQLQPAPQAKGKAKVKAKQPHS